MNKVLTIAAFLTTFSLPAFAQSYDSDLGTGNIVPPIANVGPANAYALAPGYVARRTSRGMYHHRSYRQIDRDNTSVPGQGVDKDDTTPVWWR